VLLEGVLLYWPARPFAGAIYLVVMAGYASGRLVLQFTRELSPGARRWTVAHTISAALLLAALAGFAIVWPR
jgi:prolipoprotein diacylglyceryltransferase